MRKETFLIGLLLILCVPATLPALAQDRLPLTDVSLTALDDFRAPGSNWQLAGSVDSNPDTRWSLETTQGTGVLTNLVTEGANKDLFTAWEHGDIELELDFMMPKGSNSGIYLQGRYEVQLLDSWGVRDPTYSDCGGIYERWDDNRPEDERGYEGRAPRFNASRAPGLWQHLKITFHAPRFDDAGRKIANARFVRVEHNGVAIHENVEVTGPTRGSAFDDEQPMGPLRIQGDHGPVAFRNIRYKRYTQERVQIEGLTYRFYDTSFERVPDHPEGFPSEEGTLEGLTWDVGSHPDTFLVQFDGTLRAPSSGPYRFALGLDWVTGDPHFQGKNIAGGTLRIDGRTALTHSGQHRVETGTIDLEAGSHPFTLAYYKNRPWYGPMMALSVEGPDTPLHTLNAPGSLPEPSPLGAIPVEPERTPVVLRSFIQHHDQKRTHAVSVGDPDGVHYSLDTRQAALLHAWKGPFLDAAPMWHSRGQDQVSVPQGSVLTLSGRPSLAFLEDAQTPWPDSVDHAAPYRFLGYDLDGTGRPTFRYTLGAVAVEDHLESAEAGRALTRRLRLHADRDHAALWLHVATGAEIRAAPDGTYTVDDRRYYVAVDDAGGAAPLLRTTARGQELLVPLRFQDAEATVSYSIIW